MPEVWNLSCIPPACLELLFYHLPIFHADGVFFLIIYPANLFLSFFIGCLNAIFYCDFTFNPVFVVNAPINCTTVSQPTSGCPFQFIDMFENKRCSILFHLLVPGGKWQTVTSISSSFGNYCNDVFQSLVLELLLPPPSAVPMASGLIICQFLRIDFRPCFTIMLWCWMLQTLMCRLIYQHL